MNPSIQYLIVLLEDAATSFCYYDAYGPSEPNKIISQNQLQTIVDFAEKNSLFINFLYGDSPLSEELEQLIETTTHIKIAPVSQIGYLQNAIFVFDYNGQDLPEINSFEGKPIIILRLGKKHLNQLNVIYDALFRKCSRINLIIKDIDDFTPDEFQQYEEQLKGISKKTSLAFQQELNSELSFITDRILLTQMNNCNAGISHITISPSGDFFLCPAWFSNNSKPIGNVESGFELKNQELLKLENAPICRICDAWHCKRCYFLNQKTTLEINTPSHEQCVGSHLERNASRNVLKLLRKSGIAMDNFSPIPPIDYLDPFEEAREIIKTIEIDTLQGEAIKVN